MKMGFSRAKTCSTGATYIPRMSLSLSGTERLYECDPDDWKSFKMMKNLHSWQIGVCL